ncbi:hypothetical protein [Pseudomonas sp.]|uniref:hypothetical protein n=1 Tax=Pseudomonas sp. TaxID=306 RepID=UPI002B542813|nr:hypothetical protein [Pseudomonas sp.]HUE90876.1 hypothetical protein [Pseudomonas sp.]
MPMGLPRLGRVCLCLLVAGLAPLGALHATDDIAPQWRFVHNAPETEGDQRYAYHWRVLRAALEVTRSKYGDYRLEPGRPMSEKLQVIDMQRPQVGLNTLVLDATQTLEEALLPVKIPVDKGLLGYRVFLIQAADQPRFAGVQSLEQLRQLRFGQQREWSDVAVYQVAGLPVVTGSSYEGLFHMLMLRRFDAFGRGVSEVSGELAHWRKKYPQMAIESELLLYYPLPVYFWFARTDEGRIRARRVEEGMHTLMADGTLDRLFAEEYAATIEQLGLDRRRMLMIANPHLSSNHPFDKAAYWFTPTP